MPRSPVHLRSPVLWVCLGFVGLTTIPLLAESHAKLHLDFGCDAAWCGEPGQCSECGDCEYCHGVDRDPGHPKKPCRTMPGDRDRGDCPPLRYRMEQDKRSGCADEVACWAICGRPNTHYGRYTAWFVGGGAAFSKIPQLPIPLFSRGRSREANGCGQFGEGTWGLDYEGLAGRSKVWLQYTQGRHQGGEGAYQTDGEPKLIAKIKETLHH